MKIDRELDAAIAKHGKAVRPSQFEDDFAENVENRKRQIVANM
jgi:hypothetical protein